MNLNNLHTLYTTYADIIKCFKWSLYKLDLSERVELSFDDLRSIDIITRGMWKR